jgi:hypothetical protein
VGNWIEYVAEPKKLFLAWQAPEGLKVRFRWAVGVLEHVDQDLQLRYLADGAEFQSVNQGRTYDELTALGYQGYPGVSLHKQIHRRGIMTILMRRLPPRRRPDFDEYKRQFRLKSDLNVSDLALLGLTEAKLPSDGFSVVDPLDPETQCCDLMLELAGFRYYAHAIPELQVGDDVVIQPEPQNPHDPNAVQVRTRGVTIGYINRLQTNAFRHWLINRHVSGAIERLNGKSEHPRAFIFVQVRSALR